MKLAGLVLCGGKSSRMGRDKALLEVDGEPLYRIVARRLAEVAEPVLLAPGTLGRLGVTGFEEVGDTEPDKGPLAGIVAGIGAAPHRAIAVVAVDMPAVDPRLLGRFAAMLTSELDAVVPVTEDGPQPLHAVYSKDALGALRGALGDDRLKLTDVLGALEVRWVGPDELAAAGAVPGFSSNLNRPDDL